MSSRAAWLLAAALALPHAHAAAQGCPDTAVYCDQTPFLQRYQNNVLPTVNFDTGFIPGGSPLQVRAALSITGQSSVQLAGSQHVYYQPAILATVVGETGGYVGIDYGFSLGFWVRIDVLGIRWEGMIPIPNLPSDLRLQDIEAIDDYVLPGATPRPVVATDATSRLRVLSYDLLSFLSAIGGSGGVAVDLQAALTATYDSSRVVVTGATAAITRENGLTSIYPTNSSDYGSFVTLRTHAEGRLTQVGAIHAFPTLFVSLLGQGFMLDLADIPFNLVSTTRSISFPEMERRVPLPNLSLSVARVEFPDTPVGQSVQQSLWVRNTGAYPLEVEITIDSLQFGLARTGTVTISPGTGVDLGARFSPRAAGVDAASITLRTNDPDAPLRTISLAGEAYFDLPALDGGVADAGDADGGLGDGGATPDSSLSVGGCSCRVDGESGTSDRSPADALVVSGMVLAAGLRRRLRLRARRE